MEGLIIALWIMSECKRHMDEQLSCDGCIFAIDGNCMVKVEGISNHNLTEKLANIFKGGRLNERQKEMQETEAKKRASNEYRNWKS